MENADRSQIAAAIAETQVQIQGRTDFEILCGGTDPAEEIYPTVVKVMREKGYTEIEHRVIELTDGLPSEKDCRKFRTQ